MGDGVTALDRASRIGQADLAGATASHDNNFNLIRMLAATGVLVSHAYPIALGPGAAEPLQGLLGGISLGSVCVYVFFAISGYFIAQSFARSRTHRRFVEARLLRLFPALAVVLVVTIVVAGAFYTTASPSEFWVGAATYLLRNVTLFFLQYPLPGVLEGNPYGPVLNGSLWTLQYEVLCYAGVFAAGVAGLLRRGPMLAGLLVAAAVVHAAAPMVDLHPRLKLLIELGFPFAVGVGLFVWRDRVPLSGVLAATLLLLAGLLRPTPLFATAFVVALSYASFWIGCLRSPMLQAYNRLGDYSYGMYIYAFPIQQLAAHHGATSPLLNIAVALPLTLVCAVLSWVLVEKRALALKKTGLGSVPRRPAAMP